MLHDPLPFMNWTAVKEGIQRINRRLCHAGMFLLLPMMFMTAGDVVGRTFWRAPVSGTVELSSYLLSVFILLGLAYTHQVGGHVRVSVLTSRLPERGRLFLNAVTISLGLLIIGIVAWQGCLIGLRTSAVSDMLRIPQWPFRLLVALGAFLLWLELLIELVDTIGELKRR